jgi:hypothetical protein
MPALEIVMEPLAKKQQETTNPYFELGAIVAVLGTDEVRVLARIANRLRMGQTAYGYLHAARDTRSFRKEAREEVEDCLVYLACAWLKQEVS